MATAEPEPLSVRRFFLADDSDQILVVVLAVGVARFNGGGETLPSSVAKRLRVGGIFVYAEAKLQVDECNLRACILANSIAVHFVKLFNARQLEDVSASRPSRDQY